MRLLSSKQGLAWRGGRQAEVRGRFFTSDWQGSLQPSFPQLESRAISPNKVGDRREKDISRHLDLLRSNTFYNHCEGHCEGGEKFGEGVEMGWKVQ